MREAARALARLGGKARMASMTPEERSENARRAIVARWEKYRKAHTLDDSESDGEKHDTK